MSSESTGMPRSSETSSLSSPKGTHRRQPSKRGRLTSLTLWLLPTLLSLGADYKPSDNFSLLISPITGKMTFVTDKALSDAGAYGVKAGEKVLAELGASLVANYATNITSNINLVTKLSLFTAYNNNPGNIDVNWDVMLACKLSKYITANVTTNLIYDDDIKSVDKDGNVAGPRVQLREVFGLGLSYTF